MDLVMGISENVTVLDHGCLISDGCPEDVQCHPAVIEAYLGTSHRVTRERREKPAASLGRGPIGVGGGRLLEVDDLCTYYGEIGAVRNVSFHVDPGEIVAVLGANGAGKTTLLRTISGVLRARSGRVSFEGCDITRLTSPEVAELGVCQVPEGRHVFPSLSVQDNLMLGAGRHPKRAEFESDLASVYELFPILEERCRQSASTLSGGQQQMLAIGRALMGRPRLLLLDEPSMGLAPIVVEHIFEALVALNERGLSLLMVEQNAEVALSIADRAIVLQTGMVALSGDAIELRQDARLRGLYLGNRQGNDALVASSL